MSLGMMSSRDWNEELQSARELPQSNVHEKIVRDRTIFRVRILYHVIFQYLYETSEYQNFPGPLFESQKLLRTQILAKCRNFAQPKHFFPNFDNFLVVKFLIVIDRGRSTRLMFLQLHGKSLSF